jgi:hypothetical protein
VDSVDRTGQDRAGLDWTGLDRTGKPEDSGHLSKFGVRTFSGSSPECDYLGTTNNHKTASDALQCQKMEFHQGEAGHQP